MMAKNTPPAEAQAKPFVKWVGGKRRLADKVLALAPKKLNHYFEPFVGGGAVFFALRNAGFDGPATLSDANEELINLYRVVRDSPVEFMGYMESYRYNDEALFYEVRSMNPATLSSMGRAARFILINKAGFNGLWRVNKSGACNVPWGRRSDVDLYDGESLRAASRALQNTHLLCRPFASLAADVDQGDFVYCDPPYVPVSPTAKFVDYAAGGFGLEDQQLLAQAARMWAGRGATVVVSNSDTRLVRELYAGMKVKRVRMARAINSNGARRGKVNEVLAVAAPEQERRAA